MEFAEIVKKAKPEVVESGDGEISMSVDETNRIRMELGMKPLVESEGDDQNNEVFIDLQEKNEKEREAREMKKRLKKMKAMRESTFSGRGLGDMLLQTENLSAAEWVKKSEIEARKKRLEDIRKRAKELEESSSEEEDIASQYSSDNLSGMKIAHGVDDFSGESPAILTFKDSSVLDKDGAEELENIALAEDAALKKRKKQIDKAKIKRFFDYDEEEEALAASTIIGSKGLLKQAPPADAPSEFAKPAPVVMKKRIRKRKRRRADITPEPAEDASVVALLEQQAGDDGGEGDHGSRATRTRQTAELKRRQTEADNAYQKTLQKERTIWDAKRLAAREARQQSAGDVLEEEADLTESLMRVKRARSGKKAAPGLPLPIKRPAKRSRKPGGIVFTDTGDFSKRIKSVLKEKIEESAIREQTVKQEKGMSLVAMTRFKDLAVEVQEASVAERDKAMADLSSRILKMEEAESVQEEVVVQQKQQRETVQRIEFNMEELQERLKTVVYNLQGFEDAPPEPEKKASFAGNLLAKLGKSSSAKPLKKTMSFLERVKATKLEEDKKEAEEAAKKAKQVKKPEEKAVAPTEPEEMDEKSPDAPAELKKDSPSPSPNDEDNSSAVNSEDVVVSVPEEIPEQREVDEPETIEAKLEEPAKVDEPAEPEPTKAEEEKVEPDEDEVEPVEETVEPAKAEEEKVEPDEDEVEPVEETVEPAKAEEEKVEPAKTEEVGQAEGKEAEPEEAKLAEEEEEEEVPSKAEPTSPTKQEPASSQPKQRKAPSPRPETADSTSSDISTPPQAERPKTVAATVASVSGPLAASPKPKNDPKTGQARRRSLARLRWGMTIKSVLTDMAKHKLDPEMSFARRLQRAETSVTGFKSSIKSMLQKQTELEESAKERHEELKTMIEKRLEGLFASIHEKMVAPVEERLDALESNPTPPSPEAIEVVVKEMIVKVEKTVVDLSSRVDDHASTARVALEELRCDINPKLRDLKEKVENAPLAPPTPLAGGAPAAVDYDVLLANLKPEFTKEFEKERNSRTHALKQLEEEVNRVKFGLQDKNEKLRSLSHTLKEVKFSGDVRQGQVGRLEEIVSKLSDQPLPPLPTMEKPPLSPPSPARRTVQIDFDDDDPPEPKASAARRPRSQPVADVPEGLKETLDALAAETAALRESKIDASVVEPALAQIRDEMQFKADRELVAELFDWIRRRLEGVTDHVDSLNDFESASIQRNAKLRNEDRDKTLDMLQAFESQLKTLDPGKQDGEHKLGSKSADWKVRSLFDKVSDLERSVEADRVQHSALSPGDFYALQAQLRMKVDRSEVQRLREIAAQLQVMKEPLFAPAEGEGAMGKIRCLACDRPLAGVVPRRVVPSPPNTAGAVLPSGLPHPTNRSGALKPLLLNHRQKLSRAGTMPLNRSVDQMEQSVDSSPMRRKAADVPVSRTFKPLQKFMQGSDGRFYKTD